MSEWQPIETAPRDGSWFATVNVESGKPEYEVGQYSPCEWTDYEAVGDGLFRKVAKTFMEFSHDNFHRATHWMPLPPAPEMKGEGR